MNRDQLFKLLLSILFISAVCSADAQISLLQKATGQLESYRNFSYKRIYKQKEVFSDTLIIYNELTLLKLPSDKRAGYFIKHSYYYKGMTAPVTELHNRDETVMLNPSDSTFSSGNTEAVFQQTLPAELDWLQTFAAKHPARLALLNDTTYHGVISNHLLLTTTDTIIEHDHSYTRIHLFIAKSTGLPAGKMVRARTADFGKEVTDYYTEETYSDYKINQQNLDEADFSIPKGFHRPKQASAPPPALLAAGSPAPDWTLYDSDNQKTSLSELRGKIVLLDFFFIGCVPCMKTLRPLDSLYEKYGKRGLKILSISNRDNKEDVVKFKDTQFIKNPVFPNGGSVVSLYHVTDFPTLYLIDQKGKIAGIYHYSDDMQHRLSESIDALLR